MSLGKASRTPGSSHSLSDHHHGQHVQSPLCLRLDAFSHFPGSLLQHPTTFIRLECCNLDLYNLNHNFCPPRSRAICLSIQEKESPWRQLDYPRHWEICRLDEAYDGRVYEAVELRSPQCPQCFQHVGFLKYFLGLETD